MPRATMQAEEFVAALESEIRIKTERLGALSVSGEPDEELTVERLLIVALKNEMEASELAAHWMITTNELDAKLAFARQVGDEARHYRLISERLRELGRTDEFDPLSDGYSPLFQYLRNLQSTSARVAAGQFTREGIALIRNARFIEFCESRGDNETAGLYRNIIQPDEEFHHQLGRQLLVRYAVSEDEQRVARQSALRTVELAEEIQETARIKAGISRAPGC